MVEDMPSQGARRWLIALIFVATALNYVDRQVLALLKPTLTHEFHWSAQDFAHLGSVFQFAAALALLGVGWFVDLVGVRLAYGLAVGVWSLAGMAHAVAANVQQFVIARATLAVAESVNTPAALKASALYMPLAERSLAIGIVNTAPNIGAILTPLLIPPFAMLFGWRAAFLATGALGFLWLVFWWYGTRQLNARQSARPAQTAPVDWVVLLQDRATWAVIGAKALTDQVWWFVLFWMPDFFNRVFQMDQAHLGKPIALIFSMAAVGALTSGALFPQLLRRGLSINRARKTSMFLYAVLILPIPLAVHAASPWVAAGLIGLALLAHQGFSTNIFGMATDVVPTVRIGTVAALGGVAGNLTGIGILELTGWSLDNGIGYWPMFAICAGAYLAALGYIHLLLPVIKPANR